MQLILLVVMSVLITSVSQILLKISADKKHKNFIFEYFNPYVIISYVCFVIVLILNVMIFTKVDYRYGIVLNSIPTVTVMILSRFVLGEVISKRRLVGNLVILLGLVVFMC